MSIKFVRNEKSGGIDVYAHDKHTDTRIVWRAANYDDAKRYANQFNMKYRPRSESKNRLKGKPDFSVLDSVILRRRKQQRRIGNI